MVFILEFFNGEYVCVGVILDSGHGSIVEGEEFLKKFLYIGSLLWGKSKVR